MEKQYNISVSSVAVQEIKKQLEVRETPDSSLRIGIKSGGCNGFKYIIQFEDNKPNDKDLVFNFDGLQVIVDKKSAIYLDGTTLEFENTLMRKGFKLKNPLEKSKCSCGNSFSI